MSYFEQALANFVKDTAYGDAIRHLADNGYCAKQIKERFGYPLSIEEIDSIIKKYKEKQQKNID